MSAASILDSMVSVTSLNHGGASKALSQVGDNHPITPEFLRTFGFRP